MILRIAQPWRELGSEPMEVRDGVLEAAGIDTTAGLKIVGGKADRYAKLLQKFADRQGGTVEEIRTALQSGDKETAERAAHSLKGAASTLGVFGLADRAAEAEIAIKQSQDVEATLAALSETLGYVVSAIQEAITE